MSNAGPPPPPSGTAPKPKQFVPTTQPEQKVKLKKVETVITNGLMEISHEQLDALIKEKEDIITSLMSPYNSIEKIPEIILPLDLKKYLPNEKTEFISKQEVLEYVSKKNGVSIPLDSSQMDYLFDPDFYHKQLSQLPVDDKILILGTLLNLKEFHINGSHPLKISDFVTHFMPVLHYACISGEEKLIHFLLDAGANPNCKVDFTNGINARNWIGHKYFAVTAFFLATARQWHTQCDISVQQRMIRLIDLNYIYHYKSISKHETTMHSSSHWNLIRENRLLMEEVEKYYKKKYLKISHPLQDVKFCWN